MTALYNFRKENLKHKILWNMTIRAETLRFNKRVTFHDQNVPIYVKGNIQIVIKSRTDLIISCRFGNTWLKFSLSAALTDYLHKICGHLKIAVQTQSFQQNFLCIFFLDDEGNKKLRARSQAISTFCLRSHPRLVSKSLKMATLSWHLRILLF